MDGAALTGSKEHAETVAAAAYDGLSAQGLGAAGKHFLPGHAQVHAQPGQVARGNDDASPPLAAFAAAPAGKIRRSPVKKRCADCRQAFPMDCMRPCGGQHGLCLCASVPAQPHQPGPAAQAEDLACCRGQRFLRAKQAYDIRRTQRGDALRVRQDPCRLPRGGRHGDDVKAGVQQAAGLSVGGGSGGKII